MTVGHKQPDPSQKTDPENKPKDAAANKKTEGKKPGRLAWIFNKDTRLGRLNRNMVRAAGWVSAFFALGFLTVYLMMYLPLTQDYDRLSQDYNASQQQLKTAQAGSRSTQDASQKVQADLDRTKISNDILDMNNQVLQIELALSQHDQEGALYYLKKLQTSSIAFLPEASKVDADLANIVNARVNVVALEISTDPKGAQTDLEVIVKYLQTMVTRLSQ